MSSKIRLFTNPLDAKSLVEYDIEPGVILIDWLQEEYPEGFGSLVRVFIGKDEIDLDDLDYTVQDMEQITILVMPAGLPVPVMTALISAAVSIGVGLIINLLFPPKSPGGSSASEDPVYSLNASSNTARLGEPIPSRYGTTRFPPDVASAPCTFYSHNNESNEMFVDMLFCLGQGKYDVDELEVYVGDTPISQLEKGSAFYYITGAGGHYRTMGAFSEIINRKLAATSYPYPFRENVYTSVEVEDYEFTTTTTEVDKTGGTFTDPDCEAIAFGEGVDGEIYSAQFKNVTVSFSGSENDGTLTPDVGAGDLIVVSGTANNNGEFTVVSVIKNEDDDLVTITVKNTDYQAVQVVNEAPLSGSFTFNFTETGMTAGPFRAQKQGQLINEVECDIIFPQGIYRISGSGNQRKRTIQFELSVQEIDGDTGVVIGAPIVSTHSVTSKLRSAVRSTISSGTIPDGAYTATITRLTNIPTATDISDTMVWSGLKGVVVPTEGWVYSYTTLMMVRLRATSGIAGAARQRITVRAKRLLEENTVDSSDPIEALKDIWTSKRYGLNRNESELDIAALDTLSAHWAANNVKFNASFGSKGTGWDAMEACVAFAGAKPVQNGGLLTVIADQVKPIRTAMFSSANIVSGSFSSVYNFDTQGDYDSIQTEFRDPVTWDPAFAYYPPEVGGLGVESFSPDTYNCFGCTDAVYAAQYATYMNNIKQRRRKTISFQTELEGLIPVFGDRILVSHPMTDLAESGVFVEQINATTWRVDKTLDWGTDNVLILRDQLGVPSEPYSVTQGGTANIVVFAVEPTEIVTDSQGMEPTHYLFGTSYNTEVDYIVNKVTPQGEGLVQITGQVYDEGVYAGAPPQMGGNT